MEYRSIALSWCNVLSTNNKTSSFSPIKYRCMRPLTDIFLSLLTIWIEGNGLHEGEQHAGAEKHRLRDVLHEIRRPEELLREPGRARGGTRPGHPVHALPRLADIYSRVCRAEEILSAVNRDHNESLKLEYHILHIEACSLLNGKK